MRRMDSGWQIPKEVLLFHGGEELCWSTADCVSACNNVKHFDAAKMLQKGFKNYIYMELMAFNEKKTSMFLY